MSTSIIRERLLSYQCKTLVEEDSALKEISQEIILAALAKTDFFQIAAFQGVTCLRILHGLDRFSEDLDFVLDKANKEFSWAEYVTAMQEEFLSYGFYLEVKEKNDLPKPVKMSFLKPSSQGGILVLKDLKTNKPKLNIKFEVDTAPPLGSDSEWKFLEFPHHYRLKVQQLPNLFAGKCHALLCRDYTKGRDWYDFSWYIAKRTPINFTLLTQAVNQVGPWQGKNIKVTAKLLLAALEDKIRTTDWMFAAQDVLRFLREEQRANITIWSKDFFLSRVEKLASYL